MDTPRKCNSGHAMPAIFDKSVALRLLEGLKKNTETGCWEWQKCTDEHGYGKIKVAGISHWVHRIAYTIFKGDIPEGMTVDHNHEVGCRSRACCNPEHLEIMTQSENTKKRWEVCKQ